MIQSALHLLKYRLTILSDLTIDLYEQPYTITSSALEAKANVIAIDRAMTAVASAQSTQAIDQIANEIKPFEAILRERL